MIRRTERKTPSPIKKWLGIVSGLAVLLCLAIGGMSYKNRIWNGKERFTRISIGPEIIIESFDPTTMEGRKIFLPPDFLINSVGGRGNWKAKVLPELERKYGHKWAIDSVADTLSISYTISGGLTNWWDKGSWWWWKRKIDWKITRLDDTDAIVEASEADGDKHWAISEWGKKKMGEWFLSSAMAQEGIAAAIENTAGVDGIGNHAALAIENAGLRVNRVEATDEKLGKCQVESNLRNKDSLTVKWLASTFGCSTKENEALGNEAMLKLGTDYVKWLKGD